MTEKVLSISELCKAFELSRTTVYRLRLAGEFPNGFKVGRGRRWTESVITAWLRSREAPEEGAKRSRK